MVRVIKTKTGVEEKECKCNGLCEAQKLVIEFAHLLARQSALLDELAEEMGVEEYLVSYDNSDKQDDDDEDTDESDGAADDRFNDGYDDDGEEEEVLPKRTRVVKWSDRK